MLLTTKQHMSLFYSASLLTFSWTQVDIHHKLKYNKGCESKSDNEPKEMKWI